MRGFGVAGEYPLAAIRAAAIAAEGAGYGSFWLSQPPGLDALAGLAEIAPLTSGIRLGVGALPLTEWPPQRIVARVRELRLPPARLELGIGSGMAPGAAQRLRDAVAVLRAELPVTLVVAPLGPRLCALAGELADLVLLNWLTPRYALTAAAWIQDGAAAVHRDPPAVAAYVRCALGVEASVRLEREAARYAALPHYAAHFARQGVLPLETAIAAGSSRELQERLAAYEALLDLVVVRAITGHDTVAETTALVEAAAPQ